MRLRVHKNDRVRRDLWILRLDVELDRAVEVFRGRLFHYNRLGQRLRMRLRQLERRLRQLERREKSFRRRRLELEVDA